MRIIHPFPLGPNINQNRNPIRGKNNIKAIHKALPKLGAREFIVPMMADRFDLA